MYKAFLFHPEGDYVTDFEDRNTKEEVWKEVENMGSRWIFYPIALVGTDKRIVDTPEGLEFLKGKGIKKVREFLSKEWKEKAQHICDCINAGMPFNYIY
jgi:hypothetical protein